MFKDQMQQDVIMVLKFPSNSPVTHVAANTLPHLTIPAVVTVTCSRLFAVNRWHNTVGTCVRAGLTLRGSRSHRQVGWGWSAGATAEPWRREPRLSHGAVLPQGLPVLGAR